ncbi:MAG: PepSY-associated TM helix domain-containing protein [Bryobacterales bacterium]|nr:PepSY-associated TM helix domain-containing protein [Bryobacterales bacterium]
MPHAFVRKPAREETGPLTPAGKINHPVAPPRPPVPRRSFRAALVRQVTLWHWVSSGITLGGMLLFTITGITLNHASQIPAEPVVRVREAAAPAPIAAALVPAPDEQEGRRPLPAAVAAWLAREFGSAGDGTGEWSPDEIYVSLPRPGGDAWVTVDRGTGLAHFEQTDRGWIAYFNDLHKGRHTGRAWSIYIDVLAVACLVFSFSGLILLQIHSAKRPATWPLVAFSLFVPFLVLIFFVHR